MVVFHQYPFNTKAGYTCLILFKLTPKFAEWIKAWEVSLGKTLQQETTKQWWPLWFYWEEFSTAVNGQFLTLVSSSPFSGAANFGCKPGIVGRKKGAAFGTLGGSLGLFLIYNQNKNIYSKWLFSLSPPSPYIPIHSLYGIFLICDPSMVNFVQRINMISGCLHTVKQRTNKGRFSSYLIFICQ